MDYRIFIFIMCSGLTACISVTNPPSQSYSNPNAVDSSQEIAELRREIRSLRKSLREDSQAIPSPSQSGGGNIDYAFVEELLRSTSNVASMPKVIFTKPEVYDERNILEYGVNDGENAGANGLAFVERGHGSVFKKYRDVYTESCRSNGNEFYEVSQEAGSEGEYGSMSYVYACLSRNERLQIVGRSETLFLLDGGYGIGYTEVIPYPLSYRDALQIVRENKQSF